MARVVRVRVSRHPCSVLVPGQGGIGVFRRRAAPGQTLESLLWEVLTEVADRLSELPESVQLITFEDVSAQTDAS